MQRIMGRQKEVGGERGSMFLRGDLEVTLYCSLSTDSQRFDFSVNT